LFDENAIEHLVQGIQQPILSNASISSTGSALVFGDLIRPVRVYPYYTYRGGKEERGKGGGKRG